MNTVEPGWKHKALANSSFIGNPDLGARVGNELGTSTDPVYYEIYPFQSAGVIIDQALQSGASVKGVDFFRPAITTQMIAKWQATYPHLKVSKIHAPFAYDRVQAFWQAFLPTPTSFSWPPAINNLHHFFYLLTLGHLQDGHAQQLARQSGLKLGIHASSAYRYLKNPRQLRGLTDGISEVQVENSPAGYPYWGLGGSFRRAWDPMEIIDRIILPYEHDFPKLVLGLDHLHGTSINPLALLDEAWIQRCTGAIHLAEENHGLIDPDRPYSQAVVNKIAGTRFWGLDEIVLDVSPMEFIGLSPAEIISRLGRVFGWLDEVQRGV